MLSQDIYDLEKYSYRNIDYLPESKIDSVLVLGIGNFLMGDEGIGVHTIHYLGKKTLPPNVDIIDGGTGGFDLMPLIAAYPKVVLVDATMDDKPAGTISILYPKFAADFPRTLSAHDVGLKDMIDALEFNGELPSIILITVTIGDIKPMTIELSPLIEKSIEEICDTVFKVIKNF